METTSTGTLSVQSGSSKTGSSGKTGTSITSKDMDFTKDNTASPIDLECHIQAERITKILDETIYRIKLGLCIPHLMQEFRTLNSVLSSQHIADILYIFEQYQNPLFSISLLNISAMGDLQGGDVSLKNRLNPELSHMMYIVNSYPALRPKVEEIIEEMKEHANFEDKLAPKTGTTLEYLMAFEKFRDLMVEQMDTTAAEELAEKINTRKLKKSNDKFIQSIEELRKELKEETERFEKNMKVKSEIIKKLEQEVAFSSVDAVVRLKKKILDSDRQMVLASRAHSVKFEMLKEEDIETKDAYDGLLRAHLVEEKSMRARRFKVQTQLLSWIQKYDLEMADKQLELDDYTAKYEDEFRQCEVLEVKLEEQDKEFIPLMAEREEEYHQEMTEKMNKFLLEHAARVIQNAWRDVLANRAEKKRLKRIQKKMQAKAAKAQKK